MGRPSSYKKEYAAQSIHLTKLGAIDKDLALFFGVSEVTINAWKEKHPEFLKAIKVGKFDADNMVKQSLFKRANGYSHPDTKFATFEGQITDSKEYTKHYPPDSTACIFWLTNRDSDNWKRNIENEQKPTDQNITINLVDAKKE